MYRRIVISIMNIITARPVGMHYDTYRRERKANQKQIKRRLKHGTLAYLAVQIIADPITKIERVRTYPPAIKHFDRNGNVIYKPMKKKSI